MNIIRVKRGIYIDSGCNGIHHIADGWFIPDATSKDKTRDLHRDIDAIYKNYFGDPVQGGGIRTDFDTYPAMSQHSYQDTTTSSR